MDSLKLKSCCKYICILGISTGQNLGEVGIKTNIFSGGWGGAPIIDEAEETFLCVAMW